LRDPLRRRGRLIRAPLLRGGPSRPVGARLNKNWPHGSAT